MTGKVFHLFGQPEEPEPESDTPEFDLDEAVQHLSGYWDDILEAESPDSVRSLIKRMGDEANEWST